MKKFLSVITIICFLAATLSAADKLVTPGTYNDLLSNGKLELYMGAFPSSWRSGRGSVQYKSTGGYNDGGRFILQGNTKSFLIRQDWTFSLEPGEKYYLRAKVKANGFKAKNQRLIVCNNGWTKEAFITLPADTQGWKALEHTFVAMQSRGGYYTVAILIDNIRSGSIEISDIRVEPATKQAFERSTAYLKIIPVPKLVTLTRLNQLQSNDAKLQCRWFGDKNATVVNYSAGSLKRKASIAPNGFVTLDFSGLQAGKYTVKAKVGAETFDIPIEIQPGFTMPNGKFLNNFHTVIAELNVKENAKTEFINPRFGWVLFRMPENMIARINGVKKVVKPGDIVRLPMGKHILTVEKGNGNITLSAVTETCMYQLAGGPYPKGLPKHDWNFVKKYQLPYVMAFFGGGLKRGEMAEFRAAGHHRFYHHAPIAKIMNAKDGQKIVFAGTSPRVKLFDGIYIDELALSTQKTVVTFIKRLSQLPVAEGRDAHTYVCGSFPDSAYGAQLFSTCMNLSDHSMVITENYLPNNSTDVKEVQEQIKTKLTNFAVNLNKICPNINPYWGLSLCNSNIAGSFTVDNEPETDLRVLLDMQMQEIATNPVFKGLGMINYYGDNHADLPCTRWIMKLFKHYVIEGKTELLSPEYGLKLAPGILKNASFMDGTKQWTVKGKVASGRAGSGPYLKQFHVTKDVYTVLCLKAGKETAGISQMMKNLVPGKEYSLRIATGGTGELQIRINGVVQNKRYRYDVNDKKSNAIILHHEEYIFKADSKEMLLEISRENVPEKAVTNLHYVSVMPYIGE